MSANCGPQAPLSNQPGAMRSLKELEQVIAQGLASVAQSRDASKRVALAILEVHDRKLYLQRCKTFELYLHLQWNIKRARGYQLLHFARQTKMSTTVDTSVPSNERQARSLDAQGKPRRPRDDDPVMRAMNYVVKAYEELPPPLRGELVESLQELLHEMEMELERMNMERAEG
jgi:hypothetical protein